MELCGILVGFGCTESFGLPKQIPGESEGCWPSLFIMTAGDKDSWMSGQVCYEEVGASPTGSDIDIDSFQLLCHFLHEERSEAVSLDVFHCRDEA